MVIEPSTSIRLLKGVPLDPTYRNTLYFKPDEKNKQTAIFLSYVKSSSHILGNQSYQRVNKGKLRIELKAEDVYDCNYMMFQNANFGDKMFYAFITNVEYVNNVVCEVSYEIDVMQTWYFDYELRDCFVEREHSTSDVIGNNLLVEPVDLGDIICTSVEGTGLFNSYMCVIAKAIEE